MYTVSIHPWDTFGKICLELNHRPSVEFFFCPQKRKKTRLLKGLDGARRCTGSINFCSLILSLISCDEKANLTDDMHIFFQRKHSHDVKMMDYKSFRNVIKTYKDKNPLQISVISTDSNQDWFDGLAW